MRLAICLATALLVSACGDDSAPTTDELEARAADMATPTDAAAPPVDLDSPARGEAPAQGDPTDEPVMPEAEEPLPTTEPDAPRGDRPPPPVTPPPATPAPTPTDPTPSAPQPDPSTTAPSAQAEALWARFRQAVTARDASAIETLIADPVLLNGQPVPHAEFAEMTPGGSVSDFVTTFEGELSAGDALTPAADGGYQALATASDGETESALVFRLAPDTDGTWRIVAIDAAG